MTPPIRSKPTRVLFLSHDGGMAGAQQMLLTLLTGLDRSRVHPVLVVPFARELSEAVVALGIDVEVAPWLHWVPCLGGLTVRARLRYLAKFLLLFPARMQAVKRLITKHHVDLVYSNTVTILEGAVAAKLSGVPHVWHIHEPILGNNELTPVLPGWLYERTINALSRFVIFPSRSLNNSYPLLGKRARVVYNGLVLPELQNRVHARTLLLNRLGLPTSIRLVGTVGAIQPRKDHQTFVQMAALVKQQYKDVRFFVVGGGSSDNTARVSQYIENAGMVQSVLMLGRWQGPIADVMAALDVLVISSEQESFGLTIIEAMAVETPVVSTRCGGPEELLEHGVTGFLVPRKAADVLANCVVTLIQSPDLAKKMGSAGRQVALNRFSSEKYVQSISDLILYGIEEN